MQGISREKIVSKATVTIWRRHCILIFFYEIVHGSLPGYPGRKPESFPYGRQKQIGKFQSSQV